MTWEGKLNVGCRIDHPPGRLDSVVLGISGSPRRDGNTDIAVKMVLDELRGTGLRTDFLRIADLRIERCRGCRACMQTGECAIEDDDLNLALERMNCASLIVLGIPVYWNSPPGVFKDFIDRTHGFYLNRSYFAGRKFAILSVAADSGFENNEEILESWLRAYSGEVVDKVRVLAREKGEILSRPNEVKKVRELAFRLRGEI